MTDLGLDVPVAEPAEPKPFTVNATAEVRTEVTIDVPAVILAHLDEYLLVDMRGYDDWERPAVFLHEYMADGSESGLWGKGVRELYDNFELDLRWTEEQYRELLACCPEAGGPVSVDEARFRVCPACGENFARNGRGHEPGCLLETIQTGQAPDLEPD